MKFNPIHRELVIPGSFAECFTYELQIAWLKKEIDNLSTGGGGESVKVLEEKVAALENSVATLNNKTNTLTTSVSDIEREINSIKTDLDNVKRNLENFATKNDITGFISEERVNEKLGAYETIEHAEATFVKKGTTSDYVTVEQLDNKLVDYATKIELQEYVTDVQLEDYLTKTEAEATYAKKGEIPADVLTKTEAASTYATKEEIPDVSNFITETEADAKYAVKESLVNFTTNAELNTYKEEVETNYAKKSELPDLTDYAKKSEIPNLTDYTTKSYVDGNFLAKNDFDVTIQNYVEKTELGNYVTTETAEATYAKKVEIPSDVLTKTEAASTYATKEEIPDVSNLATKQELTDGLNDKVSINTFDSVVATLATKENVEATYAKKTDIPDVSGLVTDIELSQTLEEYATKTEIPEGVIVDATVSADGQNPVKSQGVYNFVVDQTANLVTNEMLATKQDKLTFDQTPTAGSSNPVTSSGIKASIETATTDMLTRTEASNIYATKGEIPDVSNLATKQELTNGLNEKVSINTFDSVVATLATKENIEATYAKKTDIPDVKDFITKTEAANTYATKEEIPNVSNFITESIVDNKLLNYVDNEEFNTSMMNKQDKLTFDDTPTAGSSNPVTSNGIFNVINTLPMKKRKTLSNNLIDIDRSMMAIGGQVIFPSSNQFTIEKIELEYEKDVYNLEGMWFLDCNLIITLNVNKSAEYQNIKPTLYKTTSTQNKEWYCKLNDIIIECYAETTSGFVYRKGNYADSYASAYQYLDISTGNYLIPEKEYSFKSFIPVTNTTTKIVFTAPLKIVSQTQFTIDTAII